MIAIDRSTAFAPVSLRGEGKKHLRSIRRHAENGTLRSKHFDVQIYGSPEVRRALHAAQHGKCCYCEKAVEAKFAHVEHYRPKARATKENAAGKWVRDRVGYWWLAYDFENLLLACPNCNNAKKDRFPLQPNTPPLKPEMAPSAGAEQPLLVDPGHEDPEQHLTFVFDRLKGMVPAPTTDRGRETQRATELDRDGLVEMRGKYFKKVVEPLLVRWRDWPGQRAQCRRDAKALVARDAEFSAMVKAAFRRAGIL